MSEADNRMIWDRSSDGAGAYEVWYATFSHRESGTGFWIRYTLEAPVPMAGGAGASSSGHGGPYCQLWFARFDPADPSQTFGINRRFPIDELRAVAEPFSVSIAGSTLRHDGMSGALEGAGHSVRWDLAYRPSPVTHRQLPSLAYKLPVDTRVVSPNLDIHMSGHIDVDGRRYQLDGDPGGQSHLWGKRHAYQWGWAHCNAFEDATPSAGAATAKSSDAVLEALSVRLKRGQVILPNLTLFTLFLDGEEISFREPWRIPLGRSEYRAGLYRLYAASSDTRVEIDLSCRPEDLILAEYVDPDGEPAFCHNTCCGDAEVVVQRRSPFVGRWRQHKTLRSRRMAHFEWGSRAGDVVTVKKTHQAV